MGGRIVEAPICPAEDCGQGGGGTKKSGVTSDVQFKNRRPCEHRSTWDEQEP